MARADRTARAAEAPSGTTPLISQTTEPPPRETDRTRQRARPIWRSPDFLKFWTGQSISKLGDQFAFLALPLVLLQVTHSPLALGLFTAASFVPYLLFGLPAGALMDRLPRRQVMITCDTVRLLILVGEATLVGTHLLTLGTLWLLYLGTALYGIATIFFDVGYLSALPTLVTSEQLLTGNSYLQASDSTALLAGPSVAGLVFQALGAAVALLLDGLSFVASVASLLLIPRSFRTASAASPQVASAAKRSLFREIGDGLRFLWNEPVLRWTLLLLAVFNSTPAYPLGLFRMREQLHFSAQTLGIILACGAAGGLVGSVVTRRLRHAFGVVPTILLGVAVWSLLSATYAFSLPPWVFMLAQALSGVCLVAIQITILTLRQSITPDHLMGRVQSAGRVLAWVLIPLGTVAGTALAAPLGASTVILAAATLGTVVALGMWLSPVRRMGARGESRA